MSSLVEGMGNLKFVFEPASLACVVSREFGEGGGLLVSMLLVSLANKSCLACFEGQDGCDQAAETFRRRPKRSSGET